eukprot:gnl/Chilomastix_cuspidata/3514.p2 GENE.gnl/Chilomastix_cuspidata/3514~~gnl/Chilomastix_cuspidata/3514.p2  ORF type:complete len:216 (-),score=69.83 gnl/Chilomastix_cuspidata/3514:1318-1965(-)
MSESFLSISLMEEEDIVDPATLDGSKAVFDRQVSIQLRKADDPTQSGIQETIRLRILEHSSGSTLERIVLELTSEADLFFHLTCTITADSYTALQAEQQLMVGFDEFPAIVADTTSKCIETPEDFLAVLFISEAGASRFEFIHNIGYKYIEVLSLRFDRSEESVVRAHILHKYSALKQRCAALDGHLSLLKNTIRVKLPALYLQLQKRVGSPGEP